MDSLASQNAPLSGQSMVGMADAYKIDTRIMYLHEPENRNLQ